jgi:hypothetical protein
MKLPSRVRVLYGEIDSAVSCPSKVGHSEFRQEVSLGRTYSTVDQNRMKKLLSALSSLIFPASSTVLNTQQHH